MDAAPLRISQIVRGKRAIAVDTAVNDRDMAVPLEIPDSVTRAMWMPTAEQPRQLKFELTPSLFHAS